MKKFLSLFLSLLPVGAYAACPSAQQTTVTFTLTDSDAQAWAGATVSANLYNPSQTQKPLCASTNQTFPVQVNATANSSGAVSMVLTGNSAITPAGTRWIFTIQPQASVNPIVSTQILIQTGGSQSLTTTLNAQITAPRFSPTPSSFGYNNTEPTPSPSGPYIANAQYYNVLQQCQFYYNSSTNLWKCLGGNGGTTIQVNGTPITVQNPANFENGTNTTVSNPSAGNIQIAANSGSFNPSNTLNYFGSFSGLYDDGHSISGSAIPVSSVSSSAGNTTITTTSAHGLIPGNAVEVDTITGWPCAQQAAQCGSFIIASTTTNTITFASPTYTLTCSSSCGNIWNASFWGIWQANSEIYLNGHGTTFGVEQSFQTMNASFATYFPNCPANTLCNLIIEQGQDDLSNGRSVGQIESDIRGLLQKAHTAGYVIYMGTLTAADYGFPTFTLIQNAASISQWIAQQSQSIGANGEYWDNLVDYNSYLSTQVTNYLGTSYQAAKAFGDITNTVIGTHSSYMAQPPFFYQYLGQGVFINASAIGGSNNYYFGDNGGGNPYPWMIWNGNSADSANVRLAIHDNLEQPPLQIDDVTGNGIVPGHGPCGIVIGNDAAGNDAMNLCFHFDGVQSANNTFYIRTSGGTNVFSAWASGEIQFPQVSGLPVSGENCAQLDPGGSLTGTGSPCPSVSLPNLVTPATNGSYTATLTTLNGGGTITLYDEDVNTGTLNNNTPTSITLPHALSTALFSCVCVDNGSRVQSGNDQPTGCNGGASPTFPLSTIEVNTPATGVTASCRVRGY